MPALVLTKLDRCDRCVGEARVSIVLTNGGRLSLCGHHFREHAEALRRCGAAVTEKRSA